MRNPPLGWRLRKVNRYWFHLHGVMKKVNLRQTVFFNTTSRPFSHKW